MTDFSAVREMTPYLSDPPAMAVGTPASRAICAWGSSSMPRGAPSCATGAAGAADRAAGPLFRRAAARPALRLYPLVGRPQCRRRPLRAAHHREAGCFGARVDRGGDQTGRHALQLFGPAPDLSAGGRGLSGVSARTDDPVPPDPLLVRHGVSGRSLGDALLLGDLPRRAAPPRGERFAYDLLSLSPRAPTGPTNGCCSARSSSSGLHSAAPKRGARWAATTSSRMRWC